MQPIATYLGSVQNNAWNNGFTCCPLEIACYALRSVQLDWQHMMLVSAGTLQSFWAY